MSLSVYLSQNTLPSFGLQSAVIVEKSKFEMGHAPEKMICWVQGQNYTICMGVKDMLGRRCIVFWLSRLSSLGDGGHCDLGCAIQQCTLLLSHVCWMWKLTEQSPVSVYPLATLKNHFGKVGSYISFLCFERPRYYYML